MSRDVGQDLWIAENESGAFSNEALLLRRPTAPSRRQNRQLPFTNTPSTMLSSSCLARNAQQAARRSGVQALQRRAYAAAASSSSFETGDVSGLKVASRDLGAPTTKLAVVAKAGTRFQPLPGLSAGLGEFAFKVRTSRGGQKLGWQT